MKLNKALLAALLMLCALSVYAQERTYFRGTLIKDELFGHEYFITGNIMNRPEDMITKLKAEDMDIGNIIVLWAGKGETDKNGKILWVDEAKSIPLKYSTAVIEPGEGIKELKSFLEGPGTAIKKKYFAPSTEYFASNEKNTHITKGLTVIDSFRDKALDHIKVIYEDLNELSKNYKDEVKNEVLLTSLLTYMQNAAKELINTYQSAILVDQSLNTTAYQEAKPYLERIANKDIPVDDNSFGWDECGRVMRLLLSRNIHDVYESSLNEASITDNFHAEEYTLKEIYLDLKNVRTNDAATLLGDGGILTIALNVANSEMANEQTPDVETCSKIRDLASSIMMKLLTYPTVNLISVAELSTALSNKIRVYNDAVKLKAVTESSLDKILDNKTLGETEFNELFEKANGIAFSMVKEYNRDPKDPLNSIKLMVIEGFRMRFDELSNIDGVSDALSSKIMKNDFFKTDSDIYTQWKSIVDGIKMEKLEAGSADDKEKLEKYKTDLKSIGEFKVE